MNNVLTDQYFFLSHVAARFIGWQRGICLAISVVSVRM